ncbi:MAG: 4Fe-4S cluster-binding domain-containing protein, partial [Draconibacterium sp.]|nr:4Fe-4S cluster-binding domain-containing protein [Draconibacterium sp.]
SPDPDQEYFCDGLTEEIITDLSYIHDLLVISRSSAMTFKGSKKTIKQIAKKVNVQYVLEGSVRKAGNNIRIVAQLIEVENDAHLWAEKYTGTLDDIFEIQEKVSHSIVETLKLKLKPEEISSIEEHPIDNTNANEYYLKARYEIHRFTEDSLNRALVALESALEIVGKNAQLFAEIGYAHWQFINMRIKPEEHSEQAIKYANLAIELEPNNPWANVILALFLYFEGNLKKAVKLLKRALAGNPNDPDIMMWYIWIMMMFGKISSVLPMIEKTIKIDPLNPLHHLSRGAADFFGGHFISAVENCSKAHKMQPDNPMLNFWNAISLAYVDKQEDAISILDKHLNLEQPNPDIMTQQAHFLKLVLSGETEKISELEGFFVNAKDDLQHCYHNASLYSYINEKETALEWLENAHQTYDLEGVTFLGGEPMLQAQGLAFVAQGAQSLGLSVMVFSGYTLKELEELCLPGTDRLLKYTDVLVDGPYDSDLPDNSRRWAGSLNQKFNYLTGRYDMSIESSGKVERNLEVRLRADGSVF